MENSEEMEIHSDTDPETGDASHNMDGNELEHHNLAPEENDERHREDLHEVNSTDDEDATPPNIEIPKAEAANTSKHSTPKKEADVNTTTDEDGQICTICFEPWTCSNAHRLVSLRCGHLFGRSCITKWLQGPGSRCPQCNARARKSEIRKIYARTLKVLDTSEKDRVLKELEKESLLRKEAEMKCAQMNLKYQMATMENERLKKELMDNNLLLMEIRKSRPYQPKIPNKYSFPLVKLLEISKQGGCHVMESCDLLGMVVITQHNTNPLFPGYGLKKVSVPDLKPLEFISLHQKRIKDVSFHSYDGLVLTASLDKTVKLTNVLCNSVVQTYTLDCDVWSCAWDMDDTNYFFAGVRTGSVYVFDIRNTSGQVLQLPGIGERSPVISLQYLRRQSSGSHSKCGPIAGQLSSCCYYEKLTSSTYATNPLPLEGNFTSLHCESTTSHLLASFRPSQKHQKVTHTLCEMSFEQSTFSCNIVQSVSGGKTQVQLTRSKLFPHFDNENSVIICAGDEEAKAALIWDGGTGCLLDSLHVDLPVLDFVTVRNSHNVLLASLTEKNLYFYNGTNRQ